MREEFEEKFKEMRAKVRIEAQNEMEADIQVEIQLSSIQQSETILFLVEIAPLFIGIALHYNNFELQRKEYIKKIRREDL